MSLQRSFPAAVALAALMAIGGGAQATTTIYSGVDSVGGAVPANGRARTAYNDFITATTNATIEDFESVASGAPPLGTLSVFNGNGTLTQAVDGGGRVESRTSAGGPGRFNTTPASGCLARGCQWWETYTPFQVALGGAVSAFGFFTTDLGDAGATLALDFFNGSNAVHSGLVVPGTGERGVGFYGIVDDMLTFDRVVFRITQPTTDPDAADYIGFDGLVKASLTAPPPPPPPNGVPEPGSLALVGASLALLGALRRRQP